MKQKEKQHTCKEEKFRFGGSQSGGYGKLCLLRYEALQSM
jgi:hypothetical protein